LPAYRATDDKGTAAVELIFCDIKYTLSGIATLIACGLYVFAAANPQGAFRLSGRWDFYSCQGSLAITNYREAIDRVAQTSLREMIGSSMLAALLSDRKEADEQLKVEIGQKTAPWGISVSSVEIRDVAIPVALQDAMSPQAQAERERQARVILGSAEAAIAGKFVEAAEFYAGHPVALQLRAMNVIYETTKERGATILMPSSMVDSLSPSAATLALALASKALSGPEAARLAAAA
jgi:regulator of protease activity HflC (stomatin/prohibitin superfamily)